MVEEQIIQAIAKRVADDRLHFQIIIQEQTLYVYINRDTEDYVDYTSLTSTIHSAIADLQDLNLLTMELYSRMLGEVEPDWEKSVELASANSNGESLASMVKEIDNGISNTKSLVEQVETELQEISEHPTDVAEETNDSLPAEKDVSQSLGIDFHKPEDSEPREDDFSHYCFIRNKGLLNADIVTPQVNIAQLVDTFDKFELSVRRSQLPLLEDYLKNSQEPDMSTLELKTQSWWQEIMALEANPKRKLAIWLSRYCCDPAITKDTIASVFALQTAKKVAKEKSIEQEVEEPEIENYAQIESLEFSAKSKKARPDSQSSIIPWLVGTVVLVVLRLFIKVLGG